MSVAAERGGFPFFPSWDEPLEFEPAHGLFVRVAALNGLPSTPQVAFQADIGGRYFDPGECLALMLDHPIRRGAQLAWDTPRADGSGVVLRDHAFRRGQWSVYFRRYCPRCIAGSGHHRTWFDLAFVRVCPFHGVPLDGGRFDGRRVSWVGTDLLYAGTDYIPETMPDGDANRGSEFEAYVLGRMGFAPRRLGGMLDDHALADVVEAVQGVGGLVAYGARWSDRPRRREESAPEAQAAGFAALRGTVEELVEALGRVRSERKETFDPRAGLGVTGLFGGVYMDFRLSGNPLLERVVEAMVDAARIDGRLRRSRSMLRRGEASLGRMTFTEARRELDLTFDGIGKLASAVLDDFERSSIGERVHLSMADVAALRKAKETAIPPSDVRARLGVRPAELSALVATGRLTRFRGLHPSRSSSDFYLEREVGAVEDAWADVPFVEPGNGYAAPPVVAARILGISTGDLLVGSLSRDIVPAGREAGIEGFGGLRFTIPEGTGVVRTYGRRRWITALEGLTLAEAAARTGIHPSTVGKLLDAGHMQAIDASLTGTGRRRVSEASVEAFKAAYAPSARLAPTLGCLPRQVAGLLKERGHVPVRFPRQTARDTLIFRRDVLGGLSDPQGRDGPDAYADFLFRRVAEGGATYHCRIPPSGEPLVVWNSMRSLWVEVATEGGLIEATVRSDRVKSRRRYATLAAAAGALEAQGFEIVRHGEALDVVSRLDGVDRNDVATWGKAGAWLLSRLDALRCALAARTVGMPCHDRGPASATDVAPITQPPARRSDVDFR